MVSVVNIEMAKFQLRKAEITIYSSWYEKHASKVFPVGMERGNFDADSVKRISDWIMAYAKKEWKREEISLIDIVEQIQFR